MSAFTDTVAIAPPAIVSTLVVFGMELQVIVLILTAIYTTILIIKNVIPAIKAVRKLKRRLTKRNRP